MNTLTELLMTHLNDLRIAELHADAAARRLVTEARAAERPARSWTLRNLLRWPLFGRSAPRPL